VNGRQRTVAFHTLGCRLNAAETEALATDFAAAGWRVGSFDEPADAYVINTCTVTGQADRKSRNIVSQAVRSAGRGDPARGAVVVATGCFVERAREELEARGDVTYVVDNPRKVRIRELVDAHFRGEIVAPSSLPAELFSFRAAGGVTRTRAAVKIQDGCDNFCSFCIIPFVRGRAASRPAERVLEEVRQLADRGAREIVVTGVNMGRYSDGGAGLSALLEGVLGVPGDFRVRISSLEPEPLDDRFVELFAHPKMCPHLHLCLQSGSDRMLLAMRRTYRLADYLALAGRLRALYPLLNLTTDVIVGFPGETDADFEASCRVAREVGFGHIHTFKYSRREGTRAARMAGQVSERVKSERSEAIRAISIEGKLRYRRQLVGRVERVLVEKTGAEARGYGEHYVPVSFRLPAARRNGMHSVAITGIGFGDDPVLLG
jgi:threonylcarbamoyladenosine tRNA methylthiotransferase MtaB